VKVKQGGGSNTLLKSVMALSHWCTAVRMQASPVADIHHVVSVVGLGKIITAVCEKGKSGKGESKLVRKLV
jgi:hypothetical protein